MTCIFYISITFTFAKKTPRNQKYLQTVSQNGESCGIGEGNKPFGRTM